jgi:hypothetical protein
MGRCKPALVIFALFTLLAAAPAFGEDRGREVFYVAGEVSRGQLFTGNFSDRLVFGLFPTRYGWDISVWDRKTLKDDFVFVATPPYRFFNPRYIGAIYGYSAADAVALTPRVFEFVLNRKDHANALAAVQLLMWPHSQRTNELDAAERFLQTVPRGRGVLRIVDFTLGRQGGKEEIEFLKFTVELKLP